MINAERTGSITGIIAGLVSGYLIANYLIFPALLGGTITEVLQALSQ